MRRNERSFNLRASVEQHFGKSWMVDLLPEVESLRHRVFWKATFTPASGKVPKNIASDQMPWHVFSYKVYPALCGNAAEEQFRQLHSTAFRNWTKFLLWTSHSDLVTLRCSMRVPPTPEELLFEDQYVANEDLYLFALDGSWSYRSIVGCSFV